MKNWDGPNFSCFDHRGNAILGRSAAALGAIYCLKQQDRPNVSQDRPSVSVFQKVDIIGGS